MVPLQLAEAIGKWHACGHVADGMVIMYIVLGYVIQNLLNNVADAIPLCAKVVSPCATCLNKDVIMSNVYYVYHMLSHA